MVHQRHACVVAVVNAHAWSVAEPVTCVETGAGACVPEVSTVVCELTVEVAFVETLTAVLGHEELLVTEVSVQQEESADRRRLLAEVALRVHSEPEAVPCFHAESAVVVVAH